jgi:hypothetical protein
MWSADAALGPRYQVSEMDWRHLMQLDQTEGLEIDHYEWH